MTKMVQSKSKRNIRHSSLRAQRRHAVQTLGGSPFTGASDKRTLIDWFVSSGNADTELQSLQTLRNRSRDLVRNAPAAKGAISKLLAGTIGKGLRLQSAIDRDFLKLSEIEAQKWQENAQQEFRIWSESKDCDFMRQLNFFGLQRLAYTSKLTSGDTFVLLPYKERPMMPYDLRVQIVEADRVCNPSDLPDTAKIAGGIERDENGVPIAIHIRTPHPGASLFNAGNIAPTWQRVPFFGRKTGRRNVIQLIDINRVGQIRGVPVLTPVIDTLKQVSKYSEAELTSAVINAMLSVFIKRPSDDILSGNDKEYDENGNPVEHPWDDPENYRLGAGTWIEGEPGAELQTVAANRPSAQYDPFFLACMKQIGMALEIPFEVLINHFSSSYSASRAALLEFHGSVIIYRDEFTNSFCQPIYNEFLTEAVYKGRLIAPGFLTNPSVQLAYSGAYWVGSGLKQLDEVKETTAAALRVEKGFSTIQHEASKLTGLDYKDIVTQRAREKELAVKYGLSGEHNAAYNQYKEDNGGITEGSGAK
jgi:lambda family phage portal protein